MHTGEIDLAGEDIRGAAINETSRMLDHAGAGEIVVSALTAGLVQDSGVDLSDVGEFQLRGISGRRRLFNVT